MKPERIATGDLGPPSSSKRLSVEGARVALADQLRVRLGEIEAAVAARIYGIAEPAETADPAYLEGLRSSLGVSLGYAVDAIELGEERAPPPPPALLTQARMGARNGVTLETVLRRYFAGYSLLTEYVIEEAETALLRRKVALQRVLRGQAAIFDRLVTAISEEHTREASRWRGSSKDRRAERIERLLAGELLDSSRLDYNLEACHLGLMAEGPGTGRVVRDLAAAADCRFLELDREGVVWGWLGFRHFVDRPAIERHLRLQGQVPFKLAFGEPAAGLTGWRLTHRQAKAALAIVRRFGDAVVHYAEVALLVSMLQDDLLTTSLLRIYLQPLSTERDGGAALRQTLRAYFDSERNLSSAAAALGVTRHTVANRLRTVEERLERPVASCAAEIEAALRLDSVGNSTVREPAE
jgi:hypothetical protein